MFVCVLLAAGEESMIFKDRTRKTAITQACKSSHAPMLFSRKEDSRYSHQGFAAAGMAVPNRPSAAVIKHSEAIS